MRRWIPLLPLLLGGLAAAAGASPSPLQGTLRIRMFFPADLTGQPTLVEDVRVSGSFSAAVAAPHLSSLTIPASGLQTAGALVDVTDPVVQPLEGLQATVHNQAGLFGETGGGFAGVMPLAGSYRACLFTECNAPFVPANLTLPLAVVGNGGATYVSSFVNITVIGAPWTTGTVNVGAVTQKGFLHGPGSATSSTGQPGGVVSLVTPVFVSTSIPSFALIPVFGLLRVVPEPATLFLVAGGLAALGLGRRRLRGR